MTLLAVFLALLPTIAFIVCIGVFVSWKVAIILCCIAAAGFLVRLIIGLIASAAKKKKG